MLLFTACGNKYTVSTENELIKVTEVDYSEIENTNIETLSEEDVPKAIIGTDGLRDNTPVCYVPTPGNTTYSNALATLDVSKVLSNSDEINLNNNVEITKVTRTTNTGRRITVKSLYDSAETLIITPNTGENKDYIPIVTIAITFLIEPHISVPITSLVALSLT